MGEGKKIVVGYTTYPSVRTAARALGISRERLRKACKRGELDGKPIIAKTAPSSLKSRTLEFWIKTSQVLISEPNRRNMLQNCLKPALLPPARGDILVFDDYCDNCKSGAVSGGHCNLSTGIHPPLSLTRVQGQSLRSGGGGGGKYHSHHSTTNNP